MVQSVRIGNEGDEMIDGGLSRTPRPAERQSAYRSEPARRPVEVSEPANTPPAPQQAGTPRSRKQDSKSLIIGLLIGLVVVMAGVTAWFTLFDSRPSTTGLDINSDKYQAVFLSGGQVYFGRLTELNEQYLKLSEVFYIKSGDETATGADTEQSSAAAGMQLIKLGDEVHGPEDAMVINRDQVLFFENLKSDGKVSQLIQQHRQSSK